MKRLQISSFCTNLLWAHFAKDRDGVVSVRYYVWKHDDGETSSGHEVFRSELGSIQKHVYKNNVFKLKGTNGFRSNYTKNYYKIMKKFNSGPVKD